MNSAPPDHRTLSLAQPVGSRSTANGSINLEVSMITRRARLPVAAGLAGAALVIAAAVATAAAGTALPDPATTATTPAGTLNGLTVSPHIVPVGSTPSGTVQRRIGNMTRVELTSSNTAVATVPTHIWLQRGATSGSFSVTTVSGVGGCATITAKDPDNTVSAKIYAYQRAPRLPGPVQLRLATEAQMGRPEYDVYLSGASGFKGALSGSGVAGKTFALRSSTSAVTVPRSVTAGPVATTVEFTARVSGRPDCVVITATEGRTTLSRMLIFVDVGG